MKPLSCLTLSAACCVALFSGCHLDPVDHHNHDSQPQPQPQYFLDSDGDGVADINDAFVHDPAESRDSDADGVGDNADAFPLDRSEFIDSDGDGIGNNADLFPYDASEHSDLDNDGIGDNSDPDIDGDGVLNSDDAYPFDRLKYMQADADNDGVSDTIDAFPNDAFESKDTDGDGIGDNRDEFPGNKYEWLDSDGDGIGDNQDAFVYDQNEQYDLDQDGIGDNQDADKDGDGVENSADTAPYNAMQTYAPEFIQGYLNLQGSITQIGALDAPLYNVDYDFDGDIDIIVTQNGERLYWLENNGQAEFDMHFLLDSALDIAEIKILDYDFDGDNDFLITTHLDSAIWYLENNSSALITEFTPSLLVDDGLVGVHFELMDVDGDFDMDIIRILDNQNIAVYENSGNDVFTMQRVKTNFTTIQDMELADLNEDGWVDIIYSDADRLQLRWLKNLGDSQFSDQIINDEIYYSAYVSSVDFDADGDLDLISNGEFTLSVIENIGNDAFVTIQTTSKNALGSSMLSLDLEGDGDMDLFGSLLDQQKAQWLVYSDNNGFEVNAEQTLSSLAMQESVHAIAADYDQDGDIDVVAANANEQLQYYKNMGYGHFYQLEGGQTDFTFQAYDPDSDRITYQLGMAGDEYLFDIDLDNRSIRFKQPPLTEQGETFYVEVIAKEGGLSKAHTFVIHVVSDLDGDGIADAADADIDGDAVKNKYDSSPRNPLVF